MADVLQLMLAQQVTPERIIFWLLNKDTDEKLQGLDKERTEFVPYFLNYLRDQSNKLLQSSQASGLTPVKTFSLYPRQSNQRVPSQRIHMFSRVELFPSDSGNASKWNRRQQCSGNLKNFQTSSEVKSQQKLCFGQFLTQPTVNTNQRKKAVMKNNSQAKLSEMAVDKEKQNGSKESKKVENTTFDFKNLTDFPTVQNVNFLTTRKTPSVVDVTNRKDGCKTSSLISLCKKKPTEDRVFCHSVNTIETVSACIDKVNFKDKLDILIQLYVNILKENLMPNITIEIYFLIQLLTVRTEPRKSASLTKDSKCTELGSVHNCVYFATEVFKNHIKLLMCLDKSTLRLLADNPRLTLFAPEIPEILIAKCETLNNSKLMLGSVAVCSVSFQSDTDNRNNFPADQAFHVFKQQRDLFYELLREWESNHMNPEWSFSSHLTDRVRKMVNVWIDPIVSTHFARLFVSQLIAMCKGNVNRERENVTTTDFPSELIAKLKSNPEKLKRLHKRCLTPAKVAGPCPPPTFNGAEEFFRDFIVYSGSSMFNQHLLDTLVFKIHELNDTSFNLDANCSSVDDNLKQQFVSCLLMLRLLGKFLGLITFLPYHRAERMPQGLEDYHIVSRNKIPLVIDMRFELAKCVKNQRMILTVPWIVEFLSMMDRSAHMLTQIQETLLLLIRIYKSSYLRITNSKFNLNRFLIVLTLGWLFETPNFPSSLFFVDFKDESFVFPDDYLVGGSVDSTELIDNQVLSVCCSYMNEIKVILAEFAAGTGSKTSFIKKIIPAIIDDSLPKSNKLLQSQLEENFFHCQPASVKRVLDFVVERMASNVIKHTRKEIVKNVQSKSILSLIDFVNTHHIDQFANHKEKLKQKIHELSVDVCVQVKNNTEEFAQMYYKNKIEKTIQLLLANETNSTVIKYCTLIASRLTTEKVTHWLATRVTVDFFIDELQIEIEKYDKSKNINGKRIISKRTQISYSKGSYPLLSPTQVAIQFKNVVRDMYLAGVVLSASSMNILFQDIRITFASIEDNWNTSFKKFFVDLSMDFFCALIILQPSLVTEEVLKIMPELWCQCDHSSTHFPTVISTRRLLFLSSSVNSLASWEKFNFLLKFLFKEELLTAQDLESQCLQVLKQEWPQDFLHLFARCLEEVIIDYKKVTKEECNQFIELVDWLTWLCTSDAIDD